MRERSADIHDVGRRVLRNNRTSGEVSPYRPGPLPPNTILAAKELLPSEVMQVEMGVRALSMDPLRAARVGHVLHQVTLEQVE